MIESIHNQKASKTGISCFRRCVFRSSELKESSPFSNSKSLLIYKIPCCGIVDSGLWMSLGRVSTKFLRRCALSYFSNKAHARRKFDEALKCLPEKDREGSGAQRCKHYCDKLFAIERQLSECTIEERYEKRQELAKPVLDEFLSYLHTTPQQKVGLAESYIIQLSNGNILNAIC